MRQNIFQRMLNKAFSKAGTAMEFRLPDGQLILAGDGKTAATITVKTQDAQNHLFSLNENGIIEAYLQGDIDIEGSMQSVLSIRTVLKSRHGFSWLSRFLVPTFLGQVRTNKMAIDKHYELDPAFYLSFLDSTWPAYTQGIYDNPDENLATATERKLEFAAEACHIDSGKQVLEIGPGWGAFTKYLLPRSVDITALTISQQSKEYLENTFPSKHLKVLNQDFLAYAPPQKFDAISIMGVMEHLPQYRRVCHQLRRLLKPGGYAYLDASASTKKYAMSEFIYKHIFPLNHSFLHLKGFLKAAKQEGLKLVSLHDDSKSYQYTIETWANNLESHRQRLINQFGEYNFRRFRLYLWGSAQAFADNDLQCHRVVLQAPG